MATIRKRKGKWQAQVRRKGETLSRTFTQRADAARWANQTELELDRRGIPFDPASLRRIKVSDLLERYRDTVVPHRRRRATDVLVINAFLRQPLAGVRLSDLTPNHFALYRDMRL